MPLTDGEDNIFIPNIIGKYNEELRSYFALSKLEVDYEDPKYDNWPAEGANSDGMTFKGKYALNIIGTEANVHRTTIFFDNLLNDLESLKHFDTNTVINTHKLLSYVPQSITNKHSGTTRDASSDKGIVKDAAYIISYPDYLDEDVVKTQIRDPMVDLMKKEIYLLILYL